VIKIKTEKEIEILRKGGKRLSSVLERLVSDVREGQHSSELEEKAKQYINELEDTPAFLGYTPEGAPRPYPCALCVSVNDEIVHGIPTENVRVFKKGDLVSLDIGLVHEGLITDTAFTVSVGEPDEKGEKLLRVGRGALQGGVEAAHGGSHVGDIGHAIETYVKKHDLVVFHELVGHGVGHSVHEEPYIPNFGKPGEGPELRPGMVIAIEPMIGEGSQEILLSKDDFTYTTKDGSRAVHFEHTVLITEGAPEVLTDFNKI